MTLDRSRNKFNISDSFLNDHLFSPGLSQYGGPLRLNTHLLPNLVEHLKHHLDPHERKCLDEYSLQCYVLELANLTDEAPKFDSNLHSLRTHILEHLHAHSSFWVRHSQVWKTFGESGNHEDEKNNTAMENYVQDIKTINQRCADFISENLPPSSGYVPERARLVPQNYGFFNRYNGSPSHQRIDYSVMLEIYNYLKHEHREKKCSWLRAQYFLLDMILTDEEPRKKSRRGAPYEKGTFKDTVFAKFQKFVDGRLSLEEVMFSVETEPYIISNIIRAFEILEHPRNKLRLGVGKDEYEKLLIKMEDNILKTPELVTMISFWNAIFEDERPNLEEIHALNTNPGIPGCLNSVDQITKVRETWEQSLNVPEYEQLHKHRFHYEAEINWREEQYRKFLQGLFLYLKNPVNNKKIASYIGEEVHPNHVRYVKNLYFKSLKKREGGRRHGHGGLRAAKKSRSEFIQQDLENFSMDIFEFTKVKSPEEKVKDMKKAIRKRKRIRARRELEGQDSYQQ